MKVIWSARALRNLEKIREFVARDSDHSAASLMERILTAVHVLGTQPQMGRPGRILHQRELVVSGTPYIIPYRLRRERIELIAVIHGSQQLPAKHPRPKPPMLQ